MTTTAATSSRDASPTSIVDDEDEEENENNNTTTSNSVSGGGGGGGGGATTTTTTTGTAAPSASPAVGGGMVEFEPPFASMKRLLKNSLPSSATVGKDTISAFSRACGIFIIYITACANDFARENKRTTINANDILAAIKEVDFDEFTPQLQAFLEKIREEKGKKESKKRSGDVATSKTATDGKKRKYTRKNSSGSALKEASLEGDIDKVEKVDHSEDEAEVEIEEDDGDEDEIQNQIEQDEDDHGEEEVGDDEAGDVPEDEQDESIEYSMMEAEESQSDVEEEYDNDVSKRIGTDDMDDVTDTDVDEDDDDD